MKVIEKNNKKSLSKDEFNTLFNPKDVWSTNENIVIFDIKDKTSDIDRAYDIYCNDYYILTTYSDGDKIAIKNSMDSTLWVSEDIGLSELFMGGAKCTEIKFITAEEFNDESKRNNT